MLGTTRLSRLELHASFSPVVPRKRPVATQACCRGFGPSVGGVVIVVGTGSTLQLIVFRIEVPCEVP